MLKQPTGLPFSLRGPSLSGITLIALLIKHWHLFMSMLELLEESEVSVPKSH